MKFVLGIDCGLSGALAFLDPAGGLAGQIYDVPVFEVRRGSKKRHDLDGHGLYRLITLDAVKITKPTDVVTRSITLVGRQTCGYPGGSGNGIQWDGLSRPRALHRMALSSIPGFGYGGRCDAEDGCVTVRIITAHVLDGLAQIEDESVHCVVTSPPYYGLRDYGGMANPPVGMTQV